MSLATQTQQADQLFREIHNDADRLSAGVSKLIEGRSKVDSACGDTLAIVYKQQLDLIFLKEEHTDLARKALAAFKKYGGMPWARLCDRIQSQLLRLIELERNS